MQHDKCSQPNFKTKQNHVKSTQTNQRSKYLQGFRLCTRYEINIKKRQHTQLKVVSAIVERPLRTSTNRPCKLLVVLYIKCWKTSSFQIKVRLLHFYRFHIIT